jgi:hypothetical protein
MSPVQCVTYLAGLYLAAYPTPALP